MRIAPSIVFSAALVGFIGAPSLRADALITVTDPNTLFHVVAFPYQNDPFNDQQTGQGDSDIVGDANNPGFLTAYDGTYVTYRVRFGATDFSKGLPVYSGLFWIGIDANGNGAPDLFIGVNNSNNSHEIEFAAAGAGGNISPNTTTIVKAVAPYIITESSSNYNYQSVNSTLQPGITNTDLNADGKADAFLTIRVPFAGAAGTATIQGAMAGLASIDIQETTAVAYIIATSTQVNSLNQDIGGINNKTATLSQSWTQLGAITPALNLNGSLFVPGEVPEPGTLLSFGAGLGLLALARRKLD